MNLGHIRLKTARNGILQKGIVMEQLTRRISAVLGPTLVILTVSEATNLHIWADVDPMLVYLNGLFLLVSGLFIVTSHNRWQFDRAAFVRVAGWLLVVSGAYRMFFPTAQQLAPGPVS